MLRTAALLALLTVVSGTPEIWNLRVGVSFNDGTDGDFLVRVHSAWAPLGSQRLWEIVEANIWKDAAFHKAVEGDMVTFGICPHQSAAEKWAKKKIHDDPHMRNVANRPRYVTFAKDEDGERTTRVFINIKRNTHLDTQTYPPFGHVIEGWENVLKIYTGYGTAVDEARMIAEGDDYTKTEFPLLSRITFARVEPFILPGSGDEL